MTLQRETIGWQQQFPNESGFTQPQYWVKFSDVTRADVNAILGIYTDVTCKSVAPIEDEDFEKMSEQFASTYGLVEQKIAIGAMLEWRRLKTPDGFYARFKVKGAHININIQDQIDEYFVNKGTAKTLSEIY